MSGELDDHECLFQPWHVAFARSQAQHTIGQPPLWRACVVCGLWVDLLAVAKERVRDQQFYP